MKISEINKLRIKANKIFRNGYKNILNRNLTNNEIKLEAKNLLRKNQKGNLDDMQRHMFFQLEKDDWEALAKD